MTSARRGSIHSRAWRRPTATTSTVPRRDPAPRDVWVRVGSQTWARVMRTSRGQPVRQRSVDRCRGRDLTDTSTAFSSPQTGTTGIVGMGTVLAAQTLDNYTETFESLGRQYEWYRTQY